MNPLRQDDPRHVKAVAKAANRWAFQSHLSIETDMGHAIDAYHESLKAQGVVLVEAYPGDDAK